MTDREAEAASALQRLRAWRDTQVAARLPGADTIRDIHLTMVARSGRRSPVAIAEVLPQSLKAFAEQMARAVSNGAGPVGAPAVSGPVVAGPAGQPVPGQPAPGQPAPGQPGSYPSATPPGTPSLRPAMQAPVRPGGPPQSGPATPPPGGPAQPGGVQFPAYPGAPGAQGPFTGPAPQPAGPQHPAPQHAGPPHPGPQQPGPHPGVPQSGHQSLPPQHPGQPPAAQGQPSARQAPPVDGVPSATAPASQSSAAQQPRETDEQRQTRLAPEWEKFAPLDFSEVGGEPGQIQAAAAPGGGVRLRWQPPQESYGHTVYRVVSGDDYAPYDPQNADFVEITQDTQCIDDRRYRAAIRHLQVWRNSGATEQEAHANQPVLHAQLPVVATVSDLDLREDEGRVIGQWQTFPGIKRVQVYRIPIERAQSGFGDPAFRILIDDDNLGGFVDHEAERGKRYVYQFFCEAEHNGLVRLSAPITRNLLVSAVLERVTDLEIELDDDSAEPQFDLTWTNPPAGRVIIFRTERGPRAGADAEVQAESALPQMNLSDQARLAHPIVREGDKAAMRDVPWPRGWVRTYFTAVTVLDGRIQVGATIPAVRTMGVTDPVVVERTHTQVLKFGWPQGAAEVSVFLGAKGQSATDLVDNAKRTDISEADYVRLGGMHFAQPLPSSGCSIHMVGVSYSAGERIESAPISLEYPGLLRLNYSIEARRGLLNRGMPTLLLRIASEVKLNSAPPFVLVFNAERLPLEISDGDPVDVTLDDGTATLPVRRFVPAGLDQSWGHQVWQAQPTQPGFVRLFLDLPPERLQSVALLDPDINQLIVRG